MPCGCYIERENGKVTFNAKSLQLLVSSFIHLSARRARDQSSVNTMKLFAHSVALLLSVGCGVYGLPVDIADLMSRQSNPLNPFLSIITNLPPTNLLVDGAAAGLTNIEGLLVPVVGGTTQSDLETNKPCAQMTIIFARGTTEPGNMGVFAGPQLVQAVQTAMPGTSINVQGVNYTATIQGYLAGGGTDGTTSM